MTRALPAWITALAFAACGVLGGFGTSGTAAAVDSSRGRPGFCPDGTGVTVVVDFRELGGRTVVRCAVGSQETGLAALKAAGIQVTGTNRWGASFVCRLEGRPTPENEPCIDTPPASAYWSYWHAPNGGSWTYSQYGATYRTPPEGSFEGWSFSMGRDPDSAPVPRITPHRPAQPGGGSSSGGSSPGGSTSGGSTSGGTTGTGGPGDDSSPGGGGTPGRTGDAGDDSPPSGETGGSGEAGRADGQTHEEKTKDGKDGKGGKGKHRDSDDVPSPAAPRGTDSAAPTPTEAAEWTGGEDRAGPSSAGASLSAGTALAAAAAAALAVGGGVLARRRRRSGQGD
ncbi:hypothetical protein N566_13585 [Streptomycetaceae bacterium MP113-05]|nr:hypothetical protein N566_13585 [Streptomycetaceae bacterium MP113-05]